MRYRKLLFLAVLVLALSACNLTNDDPDDIQTIVTATTSVGGRPSVTILSPEEGDEVVVNTQVLVRAQATDPGGVQRVQLLANGQIVKTVSSESPNGDASLEVVLDYTPRATGEVSLAVIAYRGAVPSDPDEIRIVVRAAQAQVTATSQQSNTGPVINPNDPTCRVLTNVGLNLRSGPGTNYGRITTLAGGTVAPIIGRIADNSWWLLRINATTTGWVSSEFTTEYGICTNVPLVTPPPTPTSAVLPTNTPLPTSIPPTAAPNPTATVQLGPADLLVTNISGPPELLIGVGQTQVTGSFAATITNTGSSSTGQFSNVVIRSPGGVEIPLGAVAGLNAGESIILTTDISFDAAGSYTLQVRADSGSVITELSEVNNVGIYQVNVTAAS
jgi:hypothetical protein